MCPMGALPALTLPKVCWEQSIIIAYIRELSLKNRVGRNNALLSLAFLVSPPLGICMAYYESRYNTTAQTVLEDGSTDYGIFQINSYTWCRRAKLQEKNRCHVACSGTVLIFILGDKDKKTDSGLSTHFVLTEIWS